MNSIKTSDLRLEAALEKFGMRFENRPFVRELMSKLNILDYQVLSSYSKANRPGELHALHICKGYTEYFSSPDDVAAATAGTVGERETWEWTSADGRTTLWGVTHPLPGRGGGGGARKRLERDYGVCDRCWQQRTPSGACNCP